MWQTFWMTFSLVFLAELGDKTQLTLLAQSTRHNPWIVLSAAILALSLASLLAVSLGTFLQHSLPARTLRFAGGALFLLFGATLIATALQNPHP